LEFVQISQENDNSQQKQEDLLHCQEQLKQSGDQLIEVKKAFEAELNKVGTMLIEEVQYFHH
jgi:hypothetical protein